MTMEPMQTDHSEPINAEPASRSRTADRDFDIWQRYTNGQTQAEIGEHYGISQPQVSAIVKRMRDDVPVEERRARQRRQLDDLDRIRGQLLALVEADPIPAYSAGRPVRMPDGSVAEDHTARVKAMDMVVRLQEREAKALGLDQPVKVEQSGKLTYEIVGVSGEDL